MRAGRRPKVGSGKRRRLPALSFRARIFLALVGISSVTSLVIGLVLYSFAQDRLTRAENNLLEQRSGTANAGATTYLEGLRDLEDRSLPPASEYADELVRTVADPAGLGAVYVGPGGDPLAARDGFGDSVDPRAALRRLGVGDGLISRVRDSRGGEGLLIRAEQGPRYVAAWPVVGPDGENRGVMVYAAPEDELGETLAYLRGGIVGAIGASVLLAGLGSYLLSRQITRPLSETRDAAIRVASGDYAASVPVGSDDELGEVARAFNYMAEEIERYVGQIQEQKSRLEAVLEASPEALVAMDEEERLTMANPAAARILNLRPSDYGRTLEELYAPEGILRCAREAVAHGVAVREMELSDKSYWVYAARMDRDGYGGYGGYGGSHRAPALPARVNGSTGANTSAGGSGEIILAVRDITEHRSLEKARTAFVSDVSHELRTPLTTIQSAVGLLERAHERLDPLERRALELAEGELQRIRAMVEELLTLSQMDSWQYRLEVASASISRVVENAVEAVAQKAERFGIEVYFFPASDHQLVCDAEKLYQVFLNLLDNAIKYSDPGDRVDVEVEEDDLSLTVRVKDTGVGIPEEDRAHLFERFYRVHKDRSRATGGSGLGLAISKQIVDMHGGEISVQSQVGEGSVFRVRLPKAPVSRSVTSAL